MKSFSKKKNIIEEKIEESESIEEKPVEPEIKEEIKETEPKITLNEYLSIYNRQRILDHVIKKWYMRYDPSNPLKTVEEWDGFMKTFHNQTER